MDNLVYLLKEINILNQKIKNREESEEKFNLFNLMCNRYDEVYLHSRFLSILLDPKGSHKMKDMFVQLFVKQLKIPFDYTAQTLKIYPNELNYSEYQEIDILLLDHSKKTAVIIENKIRADDSNHEEEGQLERYYRVITHDEGIPAESTFVVYLSIDREGPSEESVATSGQFPELREKVISIHYGVELKNWLKECVKECYNKPILRETITQYINLIEDMTNNTTTEEDIKCLMELVGKNSDNLTSAKRLIDNAKHMHWWAVYKFWKLLTEKFIELGFSVKERIENSTIDDFVHGSPQKRNKADFNLKLCSPDGIIFAINADHDNSVCVGIMTEDLKQGQKLKAKTFYKEYRESLNLEDCAGWVFYKFIDFQNEDGLFLYDMAEELTFSLISEKEREKIVNIIVDQVQAILKYYKRSLN